MTRPAQDLIPFPVYMVETPPAEALQRYSGRIADQKTEARILVGSFYKRSLLLQHFFLDEKLAEAVNDCERAVANGMGLRMSLQLHYEIRLVLLIYYQIVCKPETRLPLMSLNLKVTRLEHEFQHRLVKNKDKRSVGLFNPEAKFSDEYAVLHQKMQRTITLYKRAQADIKEMQGSYEANCREVIATRALGSEAQRDLLVECNTEINSLLVGEKGSSKYVIAYCKRGLLQELEHKQVDQARADYKNVIDHALEKRSREFSLCSIRYVRIIYRDILCDETTSFIQKRAALYSAVAILRAIPDGDGKRHHERRCEQLIDMILASMKIIDHITDDAVTVKDYMVQCRETYLAYGRKQSLQLQANKSATAAAAAVPVPAPAPAEGGGGGHKRKPKAEATGAAAGGGGGGGDEKAASAATPKRAPTTAAAAANRASTSAAAAAAIATTAAKPVASSGAAPARKAKRPKLDLKFTGASAAAAGGGGGAAPMVISGNSSSILGAKLKKGKAVAAAGAAAAAAAPQSAPTGSQGHPIPVSSSMDFG